MWGRAPPSGFLSRFWDGQWIDTDSIRREPALPGPIDTGRGCNNLPSQKLFGRYRQRFRTHSGWFHLSCAPSQSPCRNKAMCCRIACCIPSYYSYLSSVRLYCFETSKHWRRMIRGITKPVTKGLCPSGVGTCSSQHKTVCFLEAEWMSSPLFRRSTF